MIESTNVPEFVNVQYSMPEQPGLCTSLHLSRQNDDEVHLCIGREFWTEFRPITDPDVREEVVDRVMGFIRGEYRIRAELYDDRLERADMQRQQANEQWENIERSILVGKTGWTKADNHPNSKTNGEQGGDGDAGEAV